jgi:hypothetical protein
MSNSIESKVTMHLFLKGFGKTYLHVKLPVLTEVLFVLPLLTFTASRLMSWDILVLFSGGIRDYRLKNLFVMYVRQLLQVVRYHKNGQLETYNPFLVN